MIVTGKNWFEADVRGLRQIMSIKPKWFAVREILQNAFDEDIKECRIDTIFEKGMAHIIIEDDSPQGFRDITDAYTLYKECSKRADVTKRGRWNEGEKLSFSICEMAVIETTKGKVTFDDKGRHHSRQTRPKGTKVTMHIKMSKKDYDEILAYMDILLVPQGFRFYINGKEIKPSTPYKTFTTKLQTEILKDGMMSKTVRETNVEIYMRGSKKHIYEMGLPVCEIECDYSINVNQRVPMGRDRDAVSQSYLQDLFSEVLNLTYDDLTEDTASNIWVREGMSDERVTREAAGKVLKERFGEKALVMTPNNPIANDDAISNGYNLVAGSEMSADEWANIKRLEIMQSSGQVFRRQGTAGEYVTPNDDMTYVATLAEKIAKGMAHISIRVEFRKPVKGQWSASAYFNAETDLLTFNVGALGLRWFAKKNLERQLDLILHEIGHHYGHHCDASYHQALTRIGSALVMKALTEPEFFELREGFASLFSYEKDGVK